MIKKLKNKAGMTLMEIMTAILIMVLLVVAMGTGMNSGMRIYQDSAFESSSAILADQVSTALGDILRYSNDIKIEDSALISLTNTEYGAHNAAFVIGTGDYAGILQLKSRKTGAVVNVVNPGSYSKLAIENFRITFNQGNADIIGSSYFDVSYTIVSTVDSTKSKSVETVIRIMNTD